VWREATTNHLFRDAADVLPLKLMALAESAGLMIHRGDKSRVDEARCGLENDAHAVRGIVRKPGHQSYMFRRFWPSRATASSIVRPCFRPL
jgi:hypothetical protein